MTTSELPESTTIKNLVAGGWESQVFAPFREGIEICQLRSEFPQVALLRYEAGASVPKHRHPGLETIIVLEGEQSDEYGDYPKGSFVINPPGSEHSVWSPDGCVVLIQWERAVEFV